MCSCFTQIQTQFPDSASLTDENLNYSVTEHVSFSAHRGRNRKPFKPARSETDPSPALYHVMKPGRRREADGTCHLIVKGTFPPTQTCKNTRARIYTLHLTEYEDVVNPDGNGWHLSLSVCPRLREMKWKIWLRSGITLTYIPSNMLTASQTHTAQIKQTHDWLGAGT